MVAIDTNILVRIFVQGDAQLYAKASKIIDNARPSSILLDRVILAEFGYILRPRYAYTKEDVGIMYRALLADERFSFLDSELTRLTINLYESEKPLSFDDCWLLALKKSGKVKDVATFDAALLKRF